MSRTIFRVLAFFAAVLILTPACIGPKYYGDYQVPKITQPQIDSDKKNNATIEISGQTHPLTDFENKQSYYASHYYDYEYPKSVKRQFSNQPVILKVDGFDPYQTELKSRLTDDKWARLDRGGNISGAFLMIPSNMGYIFYETTSEGLNETMSAVHETYGASLLLTPFVVAGGAITSISMLPFDLINMIINGPKTAITNPWFEYEALDLSEVVLTPTAELKEKCDKDGFFISNFGCTKCTSSNVNLLSSAEECSRCNNRIFKDGICQLKETGK